MNSEFRNQNSELHMALTMLLLLIASTLPAQAINHDETRLLSAPHGRPGCYAPLEVVFDAPQGAKSALVESISEGVVLTRQVNIEKAGRVATRLPWLVAKGSKVRVTINGQSDEFTPPMPSRPQPPGYGRAYAAVFTSDVVKARGLLQPGDDLACDFYSEADTFADWRMFDGYDVLLFLGAGASWPKALVEAATQLASLGGCVVQDHAAVSGSGSVEGGRQLCGIGAIYTLTTAAPADVRRVIRDHRWRGDDVPPSGPAPSRAVAEPFERGWLIPQGQEPPQAPAAFFALAGLILLLTILGPVVAARLTSRAWLAPLVIALGALALCALGALQSGPPATVEVFTVESRGGDVAYTRAFVTCEAIEGAPEVLTINLDAEGPRRLARSAPARLGCRAWVIDTPLTTPLESGKAVELRNGRIEDQIFRDFAAKARRGHSAFDDGQARILDWWLERYAYRGCDAAIAPATPAGEPLTNWPNVFWRQRGAISVTPLRK